MLITFLLTSVMAFASPPPPKMEVTHIGGPTALVEIDGYRILTDPTFDDGPKEYPINSVTSLKKTNSPSVKSDDLGQIDLVLLSHDEHADNLDEKGRAYLKKVTEVFTTASGAKRLGGNAVGFKPWESKIIKTKNKKTLKITAVPARHGPVGIEPMAGDVVGFVITSQDSAIDLLYVTGDTVWYEGTKEVTKRFKPLAVLAFAGGAKPLPIPVRVTMDANEILEFANALPSSVIIPIHQDGWAHFKESKTDIEQVFATFKLEKRLLSLTPGLKAEVPFVQKKK